MKQSKKLIILFIILALLVGIVYLLRYNQRPREANLLLPKLVLDLVTRIEIAKPPQATIILEKKEGAWVVASQNNFKAEEESIKNFIADLAGLKEEVVSTNPDKASVYEVDQQGIKLTIYQGEEAAADLIVGKMGPSYGATYVKRADNTATHLADKNLRSFLTRSDYRDKNIFDLKQEEINSISLKEGESELTLEKISASVDAAESTTGQEAASSSVETSDDKTAAKEEKWRLAGDSGKTLDESAVDSWLEAFAKLTAKDFVSDISLEEAGLANSQFVLTAAANSDEYILSIGKQKEDRDYYVKKGDSETIYLLSEYTVDKLKKTEGDFIAEGDNE